MIATSQLPSVIASRYVPIRLIAKGGMAAVYEVEHARTGERLALKVLLSSAGASAEAVERFKREARASARIKSEHVVRVTDADVAPELDGAPFLVMDLLEGADLERVAAAAAPAAPDPASVVGWLRQAARAIDKAHGLGIVHRDLKPENLFLVTAADGPPLIKVLDFGIAKMVDEGTGVTGSGQVLGTPKYMAPEQAVANARVTPATDRYSLGLIAYRLLLGESYHRGNAMSILGQLLHGELQPPSNRNPRFGSRFDAWFFKACDRDPEKRFASAAEEIEALAQALDLPTVPLEAARGTGSLGDAGRSRRVLLVGVALAAVAVAAVFAVRRPNPAGDSRPTGPTAVAPPPASGPPPIDVGAVHPAQSSAAPPASNRVPTEPSSRSRRAPTGASVPGSKKPRAPDPLADQK